MRRALPFPGQAVYHSLPAYGSVEPDDGGTGEYGTSQESGGDMAIDPAILAECGEQQVNEQNNTSLSSISSQTPTPPHRPAGLPFPPPPPAPQPAETIEQGPSTSARRPSRARPSKPPPPRPLPKRVKSTPRRPRKPVPREEECGFCHGSDKKNRDGVPEKMASCVNCGRSGHPTCMDIAAIGDVVTSYDWKCFTCKDCEVCKDKGDEKHVLFCDSCDRGWHSYCLTPQLEEMPSGTWDCPICVKYKKDHPPSSPPVDDGQNMGLDGEDADMDADGMDVDEEEEPEEEDDESDTESYVPNGRSRRQDRSPEPSTRKGKGKARQSSRQRDRRSTRQLSSVASPAAHVKETPRTRAHRTPTPPPPPIPILRHPRIRVLAPHPPTPPPAPDPPNRAIIKLSTKLLAKELLKKQVDYERGQFGELLNEAQANCEATRVEAKDKQRWERAKLKAEEKIEAQIARAAAGGRATPSAAFGTPGPSTPHGTTSSSPFPTLLGLTHARSTRAQLAQLAESTPVPAAPAIAGSPQRVKTIRFGSYDIDTWYDAPFPEEYAHVPEGRLFICEFCLKYMKSEFGSERHKLKCKARHPPGDEIYRSGMVSIFEVDGRKNKIYCQNLCLLAKMFLDHKTLYYDVEPFLFYVITEVDTDGARFVGYFSKEKRSPLGYNVSCIMTLPIRQRQGWGNLLIAFSYLLSKKEGRVGTPERPLSALGELTYKRYWALTLMQFLRHTSASVKVRLEDISASTAMTLSDIYTTLRDSDMITVFDAPTNDHAVISPGRGRGRGRWGHTGGGGVARRNLRRNESQDGEPPPLILPTSYIIKWDEEKVEQICANWDSKGYLALHPDQLKWTPFILEMTKKTDVDGLIGMGAGNLGGESSKEANGEVHVNGMAAESSSTRMRANGEDQTDMPGPGTVEDADRALTALLDNVEPQTDQRKRTRSGVSKRASNTNGLMPGPRRVTRSHTSTVPLNEVSLPTTTPRKRPAPDEPGARLRSLSRPTPKRTRMIVESSDESDAELPATVPPSGPYRVTINRTRSGLPEVVLPPSPRKPRVRPSINDSTSNIGKESAKEVALNLTMDAPVESMESPSKSSAAVVNGIAHGENVVMDDSLFTAEGSDEDADAEGEPDPDVG